MTLKVNDVLIGVLLGSSIVMVASLTLFIWIIGTQASRSLMTVEKASGELFEASVKVREFADHQTEQLQSAVTQKAIRKNFLIATEIEALIKNFNRDGIRAFVAALNTVQASGEQIRILTENTDRSVNGPKGLLPGVTHLVARSTEAVDDLSKTFGASTEKVSAALDTLVRGGLVQLDDLHAILSDPAWKETLRNISSTSNSLAVSGTNLETVSFNAAESSKDLAAAIKAYRQQTTTFGKYFWLARIVGAVLKF